MALKLVEECTMDNMTRDYFIREGMGKLDYEQPDLIRVHRPLLFISLAGNVCLRWYSKEEKWRQMNFPLLMKIDLWYSKAQEDPNRAKIAYVGAMENEHLVNVEKEGKKRLVCYSPKSSGLLVKGESDKVHFLLGLKEDDVDGKIFLPAFYLDPNYTLN